MLLNYDVILGLLMALWGYGVVFITATSQVFSVFYSFTTMTIESEGQPWEEAERDMRSLPGITIEKYDSLLIEPLVITKAASFFEMKSGF